MIWYYEVEIWSFQVWFSNVVVELVIKEQVLVKFKGDLKWEQGWVCEQLEEW